jgi:hypothetical protein
MSNIRHRITRVHSTISPSILSILLLTLLSSTSGVNVLSFGQEESVHGDNNTDLVLSGRISSMLMPTMTNTNNETMNNSQNMQPLIDDMSAATAVNDSAASQAMRFSMAKDIAWILSGDWIFTTTILNDSNNGTATLDVEFIKATTNGTMLHTHRITNFIPIANVSEMATIFDPNTNATNIRGSADVYFNDELAWPQADTTLSLMNGTVMIIRIDSEDIDDHFHNQPIYGTVNMMSKGDGFTIMLPTPRGIQERIEQELTEFGVNVTQTQSEIENRSRQAERTFSEDAVEIFNNVTDSIRQLFG